MWMVFFMAFVFVVTAYLLLRRKLLLECPLGPVADYTIVSRTLPQDPEPVPPLVVEVVTKGDGECNVRIIDGRYRRLALWSIGGFRDRDDAEDFLLYMGEQVKTGNWAVYDR